MKILIAVASKHGSTREIAEAIGEELRAADHQTDLWDLVEGERAAVDSVVAMGAGGSEGDVYDVASYDAVVAGSAIYMGRWMAEAREFVAEHAEQLQAVPVWLFSSGPLGEEYPEGMGVPEHLDDLLAQTEARDHMVFVGRLDKSQLNLAERLAVRMVKAPEGDYRDWDAIRDWARGIAAEVDG
ncbi:MAG: flavodoxin domain-containing protein [Candidatus Promineifilaceae bacterium]|nr:flavodoxin domain-containing protein [Candidatus Promineifilaceae bacterium]